MLQAQHRPVSTWCSLRMVPGAGLEPARPRGRGILSPLCLPVSPSGPAAIIRALRGRKKKPRGARFVEWRPGSELNRRTRICSPLHDHSATRPVTVELFPGRGRKKKTPADRGLENRGAGNETRTRDPDLGKVVLYQLSYSRTGVAHYGDPQRDVNSATVFAGVGRAAVQDIGTPLSATRRPARAMRRAGNRSPTTASAPRPRPAATRQGTASGSPADAARAKAAGRAAGRR